MGFKGFGCLLAIGLFWWGILTPFLFFTGRTIYRHLDARMRFATTEGEVVSSEVVTSRRSKGSTLYRPKIVFRYKAGTGTYTSGNDSFDEGASSDSAHARTLAAALPAGSPVTVYFDPTDPAVAILNPAVPPSQYFMLLFLQPFLMVGLLILLGLVHNPVQSRRIRRFLGADPKLPWEIPTWGVLQAEAAGLAIERRPRPFIAAGAAYGVSAFLATIGVAFLFGGFTPSSSLAPAGGFAAALLAAVVAAFVSLARDGGTLRLSTTDRTLVIASRLSTKNLRLDDLEAFRLEWTWTQGKNGRRRGSPLLSAVAAGGEATKLHEFIGTFEEWAVARKAGEYLAAAAGKPLREVET